MSSRGHSTLPWTLMAPWMISKGDIGSIAQITSSLFLGRSSVASNQHLLQAQGITCIINATIEIPNYNWPQLEYVKVPLANIPHDPIRLYFDTVADKIHSVSKKHGATLVHCAAGVSHSATLCIAYLMKFHNVCLLEAYKWVKARRPVIRPNVGFWKQLIDYENQLFGKSTMQMIETPYGVFPDIYESRHLMPYWGI
ncbi:dual specificity protein phosphatase 14-like [Chionomys nivalis]|uniref:dual specificity protein phosphatase 14-like n=1 Tax=Chionomys nivalis TaxID=269649 RepID=UPI00259ACEB2|nr:dual specificity protein phosphatase 14-like [Chionomys nivalis]